MFVSPRLQVFRDREGRQVSKEEFLEEQAAAKKKAQYDSEQQLDWGGGLKQRVDAQERVAAMAAEASKPFARSRDDAELDSMHRRRSRWGDPMVGGWAGGRAGGWVGGQQESEVPLPVVLWWPVVLRLRLCLHSILPPLTTCLPDLGCPGLPCFLCLCRRGW